MNVIEAIILGIIQGLAEFLPISSSGHLALGHHFFGLQEEGLLFSIVVHVATLVPVFVVFWKDIWAILRRPFRKITLMLIVATVPAAIVGFFFEDAVEAVFSTLTYLSIGFLFTGIILLISDRFKKGKKTTETMSWLDTVIMGIAQAIAIMPGISRSGTVIVAALSRGVERAEAAKFAFLMSIPIILGATVLQVFNVARGDIYLGDINFVAFGAGFASAAVSGYLAIKLMLAAVRKAKFSYFAIYVLSLAAVITLWTLIGGNGA